jgi:hypothetical protein
MPAFLRFQLLRAREFRRREEAEQKLPGWSAKRELVKMSGTPLIPYRVKR